MPDEKKEIVITVKKAENGFVLYHGGKMFVADEKYSLKNIFEQVVDDILKGDESDD